jgi:hypothetical protein
MAQQKTNRYDKNCIFEMRRKLEYRDANRSRCIPLCIKTHAEVGIFIGIEAGHKCGENLVG